MLRLDVGFHLVLVASIPTGRDSTRGMIDVDVRLQSVISTRFRAKATLDDDGTIVLVLDVSTKAIFPCEGLQAKVDGTVPFALSRPGTHASGYWIYVETGRDVR